MWIPITLAAATFQILRTSRQHVLRHILTVNGAGFVRYGFGFPLAVLVAVATFGIAGEPLPEVPWRFWPIIAGAGIAQILGTLALIRAFDLRDFAIGTVYAKTEVIIVAVVSAVALGEWLEPLGWVVRRRLSRSAWRGSPRQDRVRDLLSSAADPAALMGVLAATGLATAAVGIRAASNSLGDDPAWNRAMFTLTVMLGIQTLINGTQLLVTDPAELGNVEAALAHRAAGRCPQPVRVGVLGGRRDAHERRQGAHARAGRDRARVRDLGLGLHEEHTRAEYAASALVLVGVIGVVALG